MKGHSLPNKAIIIVGRISSGKSTLAKQISEKFDAPIASFGGYVKEYCVSKGLSIDRNSLQDIGEKFIKEDPESFLLSVLKYSSSGDLVVIEGVRHKVIFELIRKICPKTLSIFLDVPYQTRYERFQLRNKESDSVLKSENKFNKMNKHSVELEIENLKSKCDLCIPSFNDALNQRLDNL